MLLGGLGLVKTLEGTVVALVKSPRLMVRDPKAAHLLSNCVVGLDGTLQDGSVGEIELVSVFLQELTGLLGLLNTSGGEVDIMPSREPVLEVPGGLSVTEEDDFVCGLLACS